MITQGMHARSRLAAIIIPLMVATAGRLTAQENIIDKGTSGVRESARFADRTPIDTDTVAERRLLSLRGVSERPAPPAYNVLLTPSAVAVEGVMVYGATVGFINRSLITNVPFQLRAGYRRLDIQGADARNRANVNAKVRLDPISKLFGTNTTVALIGDLTHTADVSNRYEAALALEHSITPKLTLGLNGSYVQLDPEAGEGEDALIAAPGVVYAITDRTEFSLDYLFDNEVDGEDDYSFTVSQLLSNPTLPRRASLVFGAGKHRTVFATFVFVF